MSKHKTTKAIRGIAVLLLLAHLFVLAGCCQETPEPTQTDAPPETEAHSHTFVEGVCQCGETNGLEGFTLETDAALTPVVREDSETGMTLTDYVNRQRVEHGIFLLNATDMQIQTIAQYCGIPDVNYFTKTFKKFIGKTPKEYRQNIRGR